jgi:hypothetical protein
LFHSGKETEDRGKLSLLRRYHHHHHHHHHHDTAIHYVVIKVYGFAQTEFRGKSFETQYFVK